MMTTPDAKPFRIGLAGVGTVGAGVVRIVQGHADALARRAGRPVVITAISARNRSRDRGVDLSAYAWEDDPVALARREDVDCLIEVMGGADGPAKASVEAALALGKHVVTANKALMARHGDALAAASDQTGGVIGYEAAVAGGIPVIRAIRDALTGDMPRRVFGVLNGTSNFILTEMERTGRAYDDILREAQRLGYAEADPSADVGGGDAANKLALLAALAFNMRVDLDAVSVEGIERVTLEDIAVARDLGYRIKLLGVAELGADGLEQRVSPVLISRDSPIGRLEGVENAVVIDCAHVGEVALTGPGAGEGPTASAVMGDVVTIARGWRAPVFGVPAAALQAIKSRPREAHSGGYYLRLSLEDRPGALAEVATALGAAGVSIQQMRQYEQRSSGAPVAIITHETNEAALDKALAAIGKLAVCTDAAVAMRIVAP